MIGLHLRAERAVPTYPDPIELNRTFGSAIRPVGFGIAVQLGFLLLLFAAEPQPGPLTAFRWFGWAGFILCIPATTFFAYRAANPKPVLRLDAAGLTDHSSATAVGFVAWERILGLQLAPIGRGVMFGVEVREPERFVAELRGFARLAARTNLRAFGVPLWLNLTGLPSDAVAYIEHYRRSFVAASQAEAAAREQATAAEAERRSPAFQDRLSWAV